MRTWLHRRISPDAGSPPTIGYRPGLDGVRALAVIAVILYHGQVSWARGGFLGVDIFFVLSGFLITSLLLREHGSTGRIDLVAFWCRRARRLLPALFVLLAAVAVYAAVWVHPTELSGIRSDGLATLVYVSNWKLILGGESYFRAFQAPSLLAHTWSLAIEEQWYLLWPPVLLVLMRVFGSSPKRLLAIMLLLAGGSAALAAVLFHPGTDPSRVYYGTDTRAQALLIGAALAAVFATSHAVPDSDRLRRGWLLQCAGVSGAAALAFLVVRADATGGFLYRGGFLLVAIAAAAFVAAAAVPGPVSRVLAIRPLRAIGMVSYGLYLWHWPVDVVLDQTRTGLSGFELFAAQVTVSASIATVSYHLIERPIRRHGLAAPRLRLPTPARPAVAAVIAAAIAGLLVVSTSGAVSEPSVSALARANKQRLAAADPSSLRVLMLGDSQMLTLGFYGLPAFDASGPRYLFDPIVGCGVLDPGMQFGAACDGRQRDWESQINAFNPDLSVLLIGAWESLDFAVAGHAYLHGTPAHERELTRLVTAAIHTLLQRRGRVALLEVPCFGNPDPQFGGTPGAERSQPASVSNVNDALRAVARAEPDQVTFVPWAGTICPGQRFTPQLSGLDVRPDGVHFGGTPAAQLVANRLTPVLRQLATAAYDARPPSSRSGPLVSKLPTAR